MVTDAHKGRAGVSGEPVTWPLGRCGAKYEDEKRNAPSPDGSFLASFLDALARHDSC